MKKATIKRRSQRNIVAATVVAGRDDDAGRPLSPLVGVFCEVFGRWGIKPAIITRGYAVYRRNVFMALPLARLININPIPPGFIVPRHCGAMAKPSAGFALARGANERRSRERKRVYFFLIRSPSRAPACLLYSEKSRQRIISVISYEIRTHIFSLYRAVRRARTRLLIIGEIYLFIYLLSLILRVFSRAIRFLYSRSMRDPAVFSPLHKNSLCEERILDE